MYQHKSIMVLLLVFLGISILAANQVPRETVVAEFTGGKIIYGDIEDRISKIPPNYQTKYKTEDGMNSLLDMMCTEEVFYLEALDREMDKTENFEEHSNMQIKSLLRNEYRKDLIKENIVITDEEKQNFFREHAEDFYAGRIYEEVAADVDNKIRPQKEQAFMDEYYTTLVEKYNIEINESILQQIDLNETENNFSILEEEIFSSSNVKISQKVKYLLAVYPELSPQQKQQLIHPEALMDYVNDIARTWALAFEAEEKGYLERAELKEIVTQINKNVLLRSVYNTLVIEAVQLSDEDLQEYYQTNISEFSSKATRKIQVFSFETEDQAKKILKKAKKFLKKGKTEELNVLVNENSTYTNSNGVIGNIYNNGIIPGFGKDEMFSELIWKNSSEELSYEFTDIFPINKGEFVFFRIVEDLPAKPQPFEEVKARISAKLNKDLTRSKFDEVTAQLKEKYEVVTYNDRLFVILSAEEYFGFAEEAQKKRRYQDAIYYYDKVIKYHKNNIDDYKALFMKGFLYAEELDKKDMAIGIFNELLNTYEEADLHESARFMIQELEGESNIIESFEIEEQIEEE